MKVLTKEEKLVLKRVKTTKADARKILTRNTLLLKRLLSVRRKLKAARPQSFRALLRRFAKTYVVEVGCPHCMKVKGVSCQKCAWGKGKQKDCLVAEFGGVTLGDLWIVKYGTYSAWLSLDRMAFLYCEYRAGRREGLVRGFIREYIDPEIKFLRAHVEWANLELNDWRE